MSPVFSNTGGTLFTNGDRETTFDGLSLNFTKRLSNQWMMRGYVQWGEAEWDIPQSYFANNDPNIIIPDVSNCSLPRMPHVDGASVGRPVDRWW